MQHWFPNFFWWHTICGSHAVTDQISFDHKFGKPDTMRHERNGCYSRSYNPNEILNQIKSIQNWNPIILNISPTCLNWKKMEVDSDLEIYAKHLNLSEDFWRYSLRTYRGCVCRIGFLRCLILMCKLQTLIHTCMMNSLICVWISKINHCLNEKNLRDSAM